MLRLSLVRGIAQARAAQAWQEEDRRIDDRLAALERRFGKKPNIVYILVDDVGWGELGWQGGGKHRGTPTPALNRMANEGMRLCRMAGVKKLAIFHHEPDHEDAFMEELEAEATEAWEGNVVAREGMRISLD